MPMRQDAVMQTDVVLLPGLHGSVSLFEPFIALAPPWARCRPLALPDPGDQSFDGLATLIEANVGAMEGVVLFGESFSAPIAARVASRLGQKVALLVLCNPLVETPLPVFPSFLAAFLRFESISRRAIAATMTGGDHVLAQSVLREVRLLNRSTLEARLAAIADATRTDLLKHLAAPLLVITGKADRLLSPAVAASLVQDVPFAVSAQISAPHLAAQVAPSQVWAAITEEFERAA